MPADPTNIKGQLLADILADLPDGIRSKLDAEIPEPPTVSMPTDTDSAILVNGICAWYVLELFRPLAGLTLVQIPMWLGQLNTVNQGIMLASLEYNTESDAEHDFEVVEPADGSVFLPGDVRLQARATNGNLQQVAVEMGEQVTAMDYDEENGVFWGYVRAEDLGPYTITFTGLFDDDSTQAINVSFTVSDNPDDDPDDPEGGDWNPVEIAKDGFDAAYKTAVQGIAAVGGTAATGAEALASSLAKNLTTAAQVLSGAMKKVVKTYVSQTLQNGVDKVLDILEGLGSRDITPEPTLIDPSFDSLLAAIGELKHAGDVSYGSAYEKFKKLNPHPSGGYTSCPETLAGARAAMLEKYGPGTVIEW